MGAPLAVVTGASSGIELELARHLADRGYDLVIAAEDASIDDAAASIADATRVEPVRVDLATPDGVQRLVDHVGDRAVDALLVNAGMSSAAPPSSTPTWTGTSSSSA